jgi:hypothetical protein
MPLKNTIIAIEMIVATTNKIRINVMQVHNRHLCFIIPSKQQQQWFFLYFAISSSSFGSS